MTRAGQLACVLFALVFVFIAMTTAQPIRTAVIAKQLLNRFNNINNARAMSANSVPNSGTALPATSFHAFEKTLSAKSLPAYKKQQPAKFVYPSDNTLPAKTVPVSKESLPAKSVPSSEKASSPQQRFRRQIAYQDIRTQSHPYPPGGQQTWHQTRATSKVYQSEQQQQQRQQQQQQQQRRYSPATTYLATYPASLSSSSLSWQWNGDSQPYSVQQRYSQVPPYSFLPWQGKRVISPSSARSSYSQVSPNQASSSPWQKKRVLSPSTIRSHYSQVSPYLAPALSWHDKALRQSGGSRSPFAGGSGSSITGGSGSALSSGSGSPSAGGPPRVDFPALMASVYGKGKRGGESVKQRCLLLQDPSQRDHVIHSKPMARLLAALCVLHVLGGVTRTQGNSLGSGLFAGQDIWQQYSNTNDGGGCAGCRLETMVRSCPLDVLFMLDMSDSIPRQSYELARNYTANQMIAVSSLFQDTHVGFLAFSEVVHHDIPIQNRSAAELYQLADYVRQLPQERYGTELADTLRRARRALIDHTAASLVPGHPRGKVIVLVSDGCEDDDRSVEIEGVQAVLDGVYIISVAASEAYLSILKKISVEILEIRTNIDWERTIACPSTFLPAVPYDQECANVVVAMDGSDSVRRWEPVMRDYLAYTSLRYGNVDNAIGVIVFGTNVTIQTSDTMLPPTKDKQWLADQIETSLAFPRSRGTGTTAAIRQSAAFLTEIPTSPVLDAIVVITDGPALNPADARLALSSAQAQGVKVVVVKVGNAMTQQELQFLAGPATITLQVDSYLDLYSLDLAQYICQDKQVFDCNNLPACNVQGQTRLPFNNCDCQCDSPAVCPGLQTWNAATCQCGCDQSITCPAGQQLDTNTCICGRGLCANTCLPNFQQNQFTCNCECNNNCPFGYTLNQASCTCERQCTNTCSFPNYTLNQNTCNCECGLNPATCGSGQQPNYSTCQCENTCSNNCNIGFTRNDLTCACECRLNPATCGSSQQLNFNTCQCENTCTNTCSNGFTRNDLTCACECIRRTCTAGQSFDDATCLCGRALPCGSTTCSFPQLLNENTCQCECPAVGCPFGQQVNQASCLCEITCTNTCNNAFTRNALTCACESTCTNFCNIGFTRNDLTCQCESTCTNICNNGFTRNALTCACESTCSNFCNVGFTRNDVTCACESTCTNICSNGFTRNALTCACESTCSNFCNIGFTRNELTCACESTCSNFCNIGFTRNDVTCACEPTGCQQIACGAGYEFNTNACQCEPCRQTTQCLAGTRFDEEVCQCVSICSQTLNCGSGSQFNSDTCTCDPIACQQYACGVGYEFDINACQCVPCRQTTQCLAGTRFDENVCQCVPICSQTTNCGSGSYFNTTTCRCEPLCNNQCNSLQVMDTNTCTCGCAQGCPINQDQNVFTCSCTPRTLPCGIQCQSPNFILNTNVEPCRCDCVRTCPFGEILNQVSCTCEAPLCTRVCNAGEVLNFQSCTCVSDQGVCSAQESGCYNNQPAVRDCQGRCLCQCDISRFTGEYCEVQVQASMCDNCTFQNGHYIAAVISRCDMYVTCLPLSGGGFDPVVGFCAPGTILKQVGPLLQCAAPTEGGACPSDPCRNLPEGAYYGHSSHCAKYWRCQGGVTLDEGCCPQGQAFNTAQGQCTQDQNCPNDCAPGFQSCQSSDGRAGGEVGPTCPFTTDATDRQVYVNNGATYAPFFCAPNMIFDDTPGICRCIVDASAGCGPYYDIPFDVTTPNASVPIYQNVPGADGGVGWFNGVDARVVLLRFGGSGFYFDYLGIKLRVKLDDDVNFNNGRQMAIISNGDCNKEESLAITIDGNYVYFKVTPAGTSQAQEIVLPYQPEADGWLDVEFKYERQGQTSSYEMTGRVSNQNPQSIFVEGRIDDRVCALQLGHGLGYDSLKGYVDKFKVYTCNPDPAVAASRSATVSSSYVHSYNTVTQRSSIIQNSGYNTQNSGYNTHNSGSNTQNSPYVNQNSGSNTQNSPYVTQNSGSNTQNSPYVTQNSGSNTQNSPYVTHNSGSNTQNSPYVTQNSGSNTQNSGYNTQNSGYNTQNSGSNTQNSVSHTYTG